MASGRVTLSFSQVDAILASLNFVAEHKRAAFTARIKQLFRHDFLEGAAQGRGRAAAYSIFDLVQLAVAVEFLQFGMSPPMAARTASKNRTRLQQALIRAASGIASRDQARTADEETQSDAADDLFAALTPEALRDLVAEGDRGEPGYIVLIPGSLLKDTDVYGSGYKEAYWRRVLISMSSLIETLYDITCHRFAFLSEKQFTTDALAGEDEVRAIAMQVYERNIPNLSEDQLGRMANLPPDEAPYPRRCVPMAAVTMAEWIELGKIVYNDHEKKVDRLVKVLKNAAGLKGSMPDAIVPAVMAVAPLGMVRLTPEGVKITRLGRGVLTAANYQFDYNSVLERDHVDPEA